jgi:hypothetical protein
MRNLWEETIKELADHKKSFDDVIAICGNDFQITKEDFEKYSKTNYDSGYGAPEVAEDLLIIGVDFWLERHEYDGSEWWEFKQMPTRYKELPFKPITALTVNQARANGDNYSCGWETLARLQRTPQSDEVRE